MNLTKLMAEAQRRGLINAESDTEPWTDLVARVKAQVRAELAPVQLAFLDDPCVWRTVCAARQSGKSFVGGRLMVLTALAAPDRIVVYVSDTWKNARKAMWDDQVDGLPAVLQHLGLIDWETARRSADPDAWHYTVNLSALTVTFRNGSWIELASAERDGWAQFRGRKLDLLVADEMQRQHQETLRNAIRNDLPDCFEVRGGSFVGLGTVGPALTGVWYELNERTPAGWTHHTWTAEDLQGLTDVWQGQLRTAKAFGIDVDTDPTFLRERRARWVADEEGLLHRVPAAALWDGVTYPATVRTRCLEHGHMRGRCVCDLPYVPRTQEVQAFAGLDLGGGTGRDAHDGDPCAICVLTVSREEGVVRETWSEERYVGDTDSLVTWLRELRDRLGIKRFYVDGAWKMTVTDLARLYGLPVAVADKGPRGDFDEDVWVMERRTALQQGTMLVRQGGVLEAQLASVLRDPEEALRGHVRVRSGQDDHVVDSWRYAFRMIRTNHVPAPEAPIGQEDAAIRNAAEARAEALSTSVGRRNRLTQRSLTHRY